MPSAFPRLFPTPACPGLPAPWPCPAVGSLLRIPQYLLLGPWEEDEIRRDRVEPQSVSLSWREPIPAGAPGANSTEYEIRYYEKVSRSLGRTWGCIPGCGQSTSSSLQPPPSKSPSYFLTKHVHWPPRLEFLPVPSIPWTPLLFLFPSSLRSSLGIISIFTTFA